MAWRLDEHVVCGEIDNRQRGRVTGHISLAGVDRPLTLELAGDCHPDLAGCFLRFENPHPLPMTTRPPAFAQRGAAGDITAARKVRTFDLPAEEAYEMLKRGERPPERKANALYLEWLSPVSGRFVIESASYRLTVSEPAWRFTADEMAERASLAEGSGAFATILEADGRLETWDEFRHEQALRESDARGERYRRLLEKYSDHPDAERLIAREMGWTRWGELLDAEAGGEDAAGAGEVAGARQEMVPEVFDDGDDRGQPTFDEAGRALARAIQARAQEALYALVEESRASGHLLASGDSALGEFVGQWMLLNAKLAGALGVLARGDDGWFEPAFTVACLKRVLDLHQGALRAAQDLSGSAALPAERLAHYRAELFTLREEILRLIARLRG